MSHNGNKVKVCHWLEGPALVSVGVPASSNLLWGHNKISGDARLVLREIIAAAVVYSLPMSVPAVWFLSFLHLSCTHVHAYLDPSTHVHKHIHAQTRTHTQGLRANEPLWAGIRGAVHEVFELQVHTLPLPQDPACLLCQDIDSSYLPRNNSVSNSQFPNSLPPSSVPPSLGDSQQCQRL